MTTQPKQTKGEKMKVKIPKKLKILNKTVHVIRSKDIYGAFRFRDKKHGNKNTMTLFNEDDDVLEPFIHEVLEATCELLRVRFTRPDDDEAYEFHYTHREHDTITKVLTQVLEQVEIIKDK